MKRLILNRLKKEEDRTLGRLLVFSDLDLIGNFTTLELPWRNNRVRESCILSAFYRVVPRTSSRYDKHLSVLDVPGRNYILFHRGNFPRETEGCILVGNGFGDIDGDGKTEITNSKAAMKKLVSLVTEEAELIIL